jgi:hypothetical protein
MWGGRLCSFTSHARSLLAATVVAELARSPVVRREFAARGSPWGGGQGTPSHRAPPRALAIPAAGGKGNGRSAAVIAAILSSLAARSDNDYDARHVHAAVFFPANRPDAAEPRASVRRVSRSSNDQLRSVGLLGARVLLLERVWNERFERFVDWEAGKVRSRIDTLSDPARSRWESRGSPFSSFILRSNSLRRLKNGTQRRKADYTLRVSAIVSGILIVARSARIISVRGEVWRFRELIGNAWPELCRSVKHGNR